MCMCMCMYLISNDTYLNQAMKVLFSEKNVELGIIIPSQEPIDMIINTLPIGSYILLCENNPIINTKILMLSTFNSLRVIFMVDISTNRMNRTSKVVSLKLPIHLLYDKICYLCSQPEINLGVLTVRQIDILKELAKIKCNSDIGTSLKINIKTVCAHKDALLRRLGLNIGNAGIIIAICIFLARKIHAERELVLQITPT